MRCYIATKFTNQEKFHEMRKLLEANGHECILDWTKEDASKVPEAERPEYLTKCAATDACGVMICDALIFIPHEEISAGAHFELGMAMGRLPVIMVDVFGQGIPDCIFYHFPPVPGAVMHAKDFNHVIELLAQFKEQIPNANVQGMEGIATDGTSGTQQNISQN